MPVISPIRRLFWMKTTQLHPLDFHQFCVDPNWNSCQCNWRKTTHELKVFLPFLKTAEGNRRHKATMTQGTFHPSFRTVQKEPASRKRLPPNQESGRQIKNPHCWAMLRLGRNPGGAAIHITQGEKTQPAARSLCSAHELIHAQIRLNSHT